MDATVRLVMVQLPGQNVGSVLEQFNHTGS